MVLVGSHDWGHGHQVSYRTRNRRSAGGEEGTKNAIKHWSRHQES